MKKGFTLIEMLAVVLIISIIAIIVLPPLYNQIANKKIEIDESSKNIIYTGAKLYLTNHQLSYPTEIGRTYCISLDVLVNEGMIDKTIINYKEDEIIKISSGQQIPLSYGIETTVNKYKNYDDFKLVNSCG